MPASTRLVKPNIDFETSYASLIAEFVDSGEVLIPFSLRYPHEDFAALVKHLEDQACGLGLLDGFVANSTYWLLDGDDEIMGVSNLRHHLTAALMRIGGHIGYGVRPSRRCRGYASELLRLTLLEAGSRGLSRVLLTCDKSNEASIRTIQKNGGVLDSEEYLSEQNDVVQRYWIDIPDA